MGRENKETEKTRQRYDRMAPIYDVMESMMERASFSHWRSLLWSKVEGPQVLEIGVGTGKNFPYYPAGVEITAIDFSSKMLERARQRAAKLNTKVHLEIMDVQNMTFEDNYFDSVVGTFVFCSVPDAHLGIREVRRVLKPGGKLLLLEHVLSSNKVVAALMELANPLVVRIMGPNINRKTVETVVLGGLKTDKVTNLSAGIVKLIEARKGEESPTVIKPAEAVTVTTVR